MDEHARQAGSKEAVDFLRAFHPEDLWVITAIDPNKSGIQTRSFDPHTEADAAPSFIENYNGKWNLYFTVAGVLRRLNKKTRREDVKRVTWLHVDIDPREREDLESERERILGLLKNPPDGIPKPTCVIFSGGGYQAFWKLTDPIEINGDIAKAEDAKLYNLQLEYAFGGDSCHDISRIMRLPGTLNIPDARKIKKGRTPTLARLVAP